MALDDSLLKRVEDFIAVARRLDCSNLSDLIRQVNLEMIARISWWSPE
jgi:hypothetical protein